MSTKTLDLIEKNNIKWVDLRFTDSHGKEHHITLPESEVNEELFESGKMFDGSSIAGWKGIHESDMILMPDDNTPVIDPFTEDPTIILRCDVVEPVTMGGYNLDPRSIAKRAESYLISTGIGDKAWFGPEPEFFVFDDVKWRVGISGSSYEINSEEAAWSSSKKFTDGNIGHRPSVKGGYFPVPPVDSLHDLRSAMCQAIQAMGIDVEVHHHEVGTAGQCEIGTRFNTLTTKADEVQIQKYCILNVAHSFGKTATFMPKPLVGDNGSGMHVHFSITKNDKNIFAGEGYAGLSEVALFCIGGIIRHSRAINAFTNASTNSYKRLIPGFEAPVFLAYSSRNRSAAIRIPHVNSSKARRIEVRYPDSTANPYLAFPALLMAAIDGVINRIHPGDPSDKDLYNLPPEENIGLPKVTSSLQESLKALNNDRAFLTVNGVFTDEMIDSYISIKEQECFKVESTTHPAEFDLYYSC